MNFRSSNNNNNSRLELNNNEVQIINMLNNMQIQNNLLIDQLITSNNDIRSMIQNILRQQQTQTQQTQQTQTQQTQTQQTQTQQTQTQHNRNQRARRNNFTNANTNITNDNYSSLLLNLLFPEYSASTSLYTVDYVQPLETVNFTDPVPVYPSQQQIENATSMIQYGEIENPLNQSCPISLETFHENDDVIMIKHCGHIFKPLEIQHWFHSNVRCPVCRYDIREYPRASNNNNNNNEFHNYRRQRRNIIQEINTNNSQRVPFRILQRGETMVSDNNNNEDRDLNNLFTSVFRNTLITDLSNNSL